MSKGGSPMGGGGFGGQQGFGGGFGGQQGGFGGGFGGQQDFGGFGGGFNQMPQQQRGGFGGGYQPSRQRFNQMPQQQMGYGGGFGGQMQGFGMPQQQQGFGNTFARTMPPQQGFAPAVNNYARPMRDPMRPMVSFPAPEQDLTPTQQAAMEQQRREQNAYLSQFTPTQEEIARNTALYGGNRNAEGGMGGGSQPGGNLLGGAFFGGGSQPVLGQPGGNLVGGGQQAQMPSNPYAQQVRQEDPRMQAMRMMQRMRFGGGGGYDF